MAGVRLQTWADVGRRVALARDRAGFTQLTLAERLGLHRSAVTRVELGQRQLDALELAQIADALGRSVEWFLTEPPRSIASHREGLSEDADVRRLEEELERAGRDVELLVDIRALALTAPVLPAGVSSLAEAESGARDARDLLGVDDGPLTDLETVVERVGLLAFSLDLGPSIIDGGYVRVDDLGVALVNGTTDAGRRRFTLAHELGHHLLADEYTPDFGLGSTRSERESLINAFAIHLLMPRTAVNARWEELGNAFEDARQRLIIIAAEYHVSWTAAISHARTLGLITRDEFALLETRRPTATDYIELGVRFTTELEPVRLPVAYAQATVRAYRRGLISADRAVELMRGTINDEDLPSTDEIPIEALAREFEGLE